MAACGTDAGAPGTRSQEKAHPLHLQVQRATQVRAVGVLRPHTENDSRFNHQLINNSTACGVCSFGCGAASCCTLCSRPWASMAWCSVALCSAYPVVCACGPAFPGHQVPSLPGAQCGDSGGVRAVVIVARRLSTRSDKRAAMQYLR